MFDSLQILGIFAVARMLEKSLAIQGRALGPRLVRNSGRILSTPAALPIFIDPKAASISSLLKGDAKLFEFGIFLIFESCLETDLLFFDGIFIMEVLKR